MKQNATKPYKLVQFKTDSQFSLPNPGLRAYFARTEAGSPEDYRTPYGGKAPREEILGKWNAIFENWYKSADQSLFSTLKEFELEMAKKVGPLSIQKPLSERMDSILEYWEDSNVDTNESLLNSKELGEAREAFLKEFRTIGGLRVRSPRKTLEKMKLSTNSGVPYFTRKRSVAQKVLAEAIDIVENEKYESLKDVGAVIGGRGQEGGPSPDDVKQRTVWMLPFIIQLLELSFYQPFIEAVQKHCLIPAYVSIEAVEERITKLFDTKDPADTVVVTDFKGMDQHFNVNMQHLAMMGLTHLANHSDKATADGFPYIFNLKFNIPLIINQTTAIEGKHGMSSGSGGTNADESVAHRTLQHYAAICNGQKLNPNSQALGDDGILSYPGITVDQVIEAYSRFGQVMNKSKQYASTEDTVYLRRWYHTKYRTDGCMKGVYSSFRALGRLMGQERFYDPKVGDSKMITLRAGSILENCANHPIFEKLVDFVIEGDKYRLGLDIPGFLDGINREGSRAKAKLPSFMSYTQDVQTEKGITEWKIYKYLLSKTR